MLPDLSEHSLFSKLLDLSKLLFVTVICVTGISIVQANAAPTAASVKSKTGTTVTKTGSNILSTTTESKTASYNAKALHRLDFKVVGKSCAVCLLNIQKRVSTVPGAIKAAVQLQSPYAAVILFDSSKTSQKILLDKAKEGLPEVKFEAIEDTPIEKLPGVLVPKIGNTVLTN
jgi:copper chaperone CopZ